MSGHAPAVVRLPAPERTVPARFNATMVCQVGAIAGLVLSVIGAYVNERQFAYSWFFAFYVFFTIAFGSLFWVLLHYACDSEWTVLVRRVFENITGLFPALFVIFLPLILFPGMRDTLWTWMSPVHIHDHELIDRDGWLYKGLPFGFAPRVVLYFLYFGLTGFYYRRWSIQQDADGTPVLTRRMHDLSYILLVVFGVIETFAGFDWLMGMDWRWSSSLFGVYNFAVSAQASMAMGIVLVAWLRWNGYLAAVNAEHYHLMGKLLFGFSIFWAYIAFGQFLLIWYANIPEETIFYNDHNRGHWTLLTHFIIVGKFMFPVIYLLSQDTKRNLRTLTAIALWILFMHAVELYWFIMPYAHQRTICPSWQDLVALGTVGCILGRIFICLTCSAALFPQRDPRLVECLTITN
jgi:hypothetical protein